MSDINYYIGVQYSNSHKQMRPFLIITVRLESMALGRSSNKTFSFLFPTGCLYLFLFPHLPAVAASLLFLAVNNLCASIFLLASVVTQVPLFIENFPKL